MMVRLKKAGLLISQSDDPEINISVAWSTLSRLGLPARFGGRAQDGSYEYVVVDPLSGDFVATGRGETLEHSMCEAALNALSRIDSS